MPWTDEPLAAETSLIRHPLAALNRAGFFTITSQPAMRNVSSDNILFGWGGPGAFVHQRNYGKLTRTYYFSHRLVVEMLVSPFAFRVMKETLIKKDFRVLTFHAINSSGEYESNSNGNPIPLSWLSFKNMSGIRIAAVFDQRYFTAWSRDFYHLFGKNWMELYDEGSESHRLLKMVTFLAYLPSHC